MSLDSDLASVASLVSPMDPAELGSSAAEVEEGCCFVGDIGSEGVFGMSRRMGVAGR
jgi:hypothetical protein